METLIFFIWKDAYSQQLRDTELKVGGKVNKRSEFIRLCLRLRRNPVTGEKTIRERGDIIETSASPDAAVLLSLSDKL